MSLGPESDPLYRARAGPATPTRTHHTLSAHAARRRLVLYGTNGAAGSAVDADTRDCVSPLNKLRIQQFTRIIKV